VFIKCVHHVNISFFGVRTVIDSIFWPALFSCSINGHFHPFQSLVPIYFRSRLALVLSSLGTLGRGAITKSSLNACALGVVQVPISSIRAVAAHHAMI
jgi:hypothetical protein